MTTQASKFNFTNRKNSSFSNAFSEHSYLLLTLALVFGVAVTLILLITRLISVLYISDAVEENLE